MTDFVPLVDLHLQHAAIADDVVAGLDRVFGRTAFVLGEEVAQFEAAFAAFQGVDHCVGVANGTDALELALRAVDLPPGAEVVLPANTFVASAFAVVRAGGVPVLVDVDPDTLLADPEAVAAAVTPRTAAVMPVHLYGQMAPMEGLSSLGVPVVEDAAQAQGATRNGVGAGAWGEVAGTSFYPGKNLGAYGDAGAVLTRSEEVAARVRALRNHGSEVKYEHPAPGFNSRLDTVQAVVLLAKLQRLAAWNEERRTAAVRYLDLLAGVEGVVLPVTDDGNVHVWHLFVVRVPERDRVVATLNGAGIGAGVHYPKPVHLHGAFSSLGLGEGAFPVAEEAARTVLSLPIYPGITASQQERVVVELRKALRP